MGSDKETKIRKIKLLDKEASTSSNFGGKPGSLVEGIKEERVVRVTKESDESGGKNQLKSSMRIKNTLEECKKALKLGNKKQLYVHVRDRRILTENKEVYKKENNTLRRGK